MSDVLIPVLEDFKRRLERIETKLEEIQTGKNKTEEEKSLQMGEIKDYLEKIHMA